jgi:hypothetical protein
VTCVTVAMGSDISRAWSTQGPVSR